jgi:N-acetylglucosamine kinase-like BadF-type ATPase
LKYLIGIDSGGSKFLVKAADLMGKTVGIYEATPAGFRFSSLEQGVKDVSNHIQHCLDQFGGVRENCAALVCGSTGIDSDTDYVRIKAVYENLGGFQCPIKCVNDAEVALQAATGGVGVIVIAGTGSIAFGRNSQNETTRSGGWWFSMGADEGSGTHISLRALQHLGAWFDRQLPEDELIANLRDTLALQTREDLIKMGRSSVSVWSQLKLPQLVDEAAENGCLSALRIMEEASYHTFCLGNSVVSKLKLYEEPVFRVGVWGSAIARSPIHYRLFAERFQRCYENVDVVLPDQDAASGAVLMALELYRQHV